MAKHPGFEDLILYEDGDLLAVNKPPRLASEVDRSDPRAPYLSQMARAYHPGTSLCHRLDKETSGVILIAKSPEMYRHVSLQFQHRDIQKIYHAIVEGIHQFDHFKVDKPLSKVGNKVARVNFKTGKRSITYISTLKQFGHFTLLACKPETGRYHQVRCHLAAIKTPISADRLYGGKPPMLSKIKKNYRHKPDQEELPMMSRVALHARSITLNLFSGETITIIAPYPRDLGKFLKILEKNDRQAT